MEETTQVKETVAQEALRLLSSVPADEFIANMFTDYVGKCCAIGHYQRLKSGMPDDYSVNNCVDWANNSFRKVTETFLESKYGLHYNDISSVNNTTLVNGYKEPEIKDRVIHLLNDMVAEGL